MIPSSSKRPRNGCPWRSELLKIAYKIFPDPHGGVLYSAVLNVQLALASQNAPRTKRLEAVIDSGASRCIFHSAIGRSIGLDIRSGMKEEVMGISGSQTMYIHEISLYVPGGAVVTRAGFSDDLPLAGLLGMKGFFEHFKILFDPVQQACELERLHKA